jgi:methylisocitrate lyase
MSLASPGKLFKSLVHNTPPLQILGTINAYSAMLAEQAGAFAIYLSGAGVANASYGLPDLGMTTLTEVLLDVNRITETTALPLLVDVDTGFGHELNLARMVKMMEKAGVAAIHIEDQEAAKRCGHRPNKAIVSQQEMGDRIKAAVDARIDPDFVIMARTDAFANEGLDAAIERAQFYVEQGADMIFPDALTTLDQYHAFTHALKVPVLANMTEFGLTPPYTKEELKQAGLGLILYPLSAFRAMSKAALDVYRTILREGTQHSMLGNMQEREALYEVLNYHKLERKLDTSS